jgi:hypothetical protein
MERIVGTLQLRARDACGRGPRKGEQGPDRPGGTSNLHGKESRDRVNERDDPMVDSVHTHAERPRGGSTV